MKKLIYSTLAIVALSLTTNAQTEPAKKEAKPKKEAAAKPTAAATEVTPAKTESAPAKTEPAKKSGTRMAINEKGLPGEKKSNSSTTNNPK